MLFKFFPLLHIEGSTTFGDVLKTPTGAAITIAVGVVLAIVFVIMVRRGKKGGTTEAEGSAPVAATPAAVSAAAPITNPNLVPALGSLGEIKLNDVGEKQAAMVMAIVADTLETPLNELRFISIKKV